MEGLGAPYPDADFEEMRQMREDLASLRKRWQLVRGTYEELDIQQEYGRLKRRLLKFKVASRHKWAHHVVEECQAAVVTHDSGPFYRG